MNGSPARNPCLASLLDAAMLYPSHGRTFFAMPAFAAPWRSGTIVPAKTLASRGGG